MNSAAIKVTMPGKGEVTLRPLDHLATGGEGSVYLKNKLIYKLFLQPERAAAAGMAEKIGLLAQIRHPFIVAPIDVLHDAQHRMVGYYMAQAEGVPLMKTFTNSWRDQNGFTDAQSAQLVENMREAVMAAHALQAVMVDGNETNYLAHGIEPRIIDVDSWQIGKHPATAIMPSVRDYHAACLDEKSDWFSWGVVSFQVFTGIHPYKGTHPGFKKGDLEARMRANASVFDSRVRLNAAVRDFARIPPRLLDWYEGVFAQGERSAPPSVLASAAPAHLTRRLRVVQAQAASPANVRHERVHGFAGAVRHVSANGVAFHAEHAGPDAPLRAFDLVRRQYLPSLTQEEIARMFANQAALVRHGDGFVLVSKTDTGLAGRIVAGERDPVRAQGSTNALPLSATRLVMFGNRLFALNPNSDNGLVELELVAMGARSTLSIKMAWSGTVQSMRFFDGLAVMDCLGTPFLVVPEGDTLAMRRAAALAPYKLINGFARSSARIWLHGVSREDGQIYRLELRCGEREAELLEAKVVDEAEMNLDVSARGIAVAIWDDGMLTVQNTQGAGARQVADGALSRTMHLFALPDGIYYYQGADVFKLTLS
jgi:hypothetical protein